VAERLARRHRVAGRHRRAFQTMGPFWLPTINTALLLTSAVTLTIAHHALQENQRAKTIGFMWVTVMLGIVFLCVQAYEYFHAYRDLNLKLSLRRLRLHLLHAHRLPRLPRVRGHADAAVHHAAPAKGPLHAERHFGFEGAAWYWHFVDVVWLGLYVLVYWM
jgi:cytochrome c oxidase subunit 3